MRLGVALSDKLPLLSVDCLHGTQPVIVDSKMLLFGILVAVVVLFTAQETSMQPTYHDDNGMSNEVRSLGTECSDVKRSMDVLTNEITRLSKAIDSSKSSPITGRDVHRCSTLCRTQVDIQVDRYLIMKHRVKYPIMGTLRFMTPRTYKLCRSWRDSTPSCS